MCIRMSGAYAHLGAHRRQQLRRVDGLVRADLRLSAWL